MILKEIIEKDPELSKLFSKTRSSLDLITKFSGKKLRFNEGDKYYPEGSYDATDQLIDNIIKIDIECGSIVKDYMAIYGAHNVRGCGFDDVAYTESDFLNIVRELNINYERDNLEGIQNENINNSGKFINQCYHNDENMDCE